MLLEIKCKNCGGEKLSVYPRRETIIIRCEECFERPEFTVKTQVRPKRISARTNEETPSHPETKEGLGAGPDFITQKRKHGPKPSGNAKSGAERTREFRARKAEHRISSVR